MSQLSLADRMAIVVANFGRDFGWHVLSSDDEPLAALTECTSVDMFWNSYLVTPLAGHTATLTESFWHPDRHNIRNIRYPNFIVQAFGHFDCESNRVTLRSTYISVDFSWLERLRAPLWFLRRSI